MTTSNGTPPSPSPFDHAPPSGAAQTVSAILGEIVWLMSSSPMHKPFFISDLEWPVAPGATTQGNR